MSTADANPYEIGLDKNPANHVPLSPIGFLLRSAAVYPDRVAVMAPNVPEAFEAHFGVPMAGAVLNALNIRLDPETIAFILRHGEAKVLITDTEFAPVVKEALARLEQKPVI